MSLVFSVRVLFYTDALNDGASCGTGESTATALHTEHDSGFLKHSHLIVDILDIVSVGECGGIEGKGDKHRHTYRNGYNGSSSWERRPFRS